jgi:RNA polymerase sigma-70 factor (ECF subfamily)
MPLLFDISGFEALFHVNYKPVVITAYRITQDKDIAEDIAQRVFAKMWEERNSLVISTSLRSYLFQNAIDQSLDYLKKIKDVTATEALFNTSGEEIFPSVKYPMSIKGTGRQIEDAISLLPMACRIIFVLSRYEHLKYKEIAQRLDISVNIVEDQITRALKHLMKCFY